MARLAGSALSLEIGGASAGGVERRHGEQASFWDLLSRGGELEWLVDGLDALLWLERGLGRHQPTFTQGEV